MKSLYLLTVMMPMEFIMMYAIIKFVVNVRVRMYTTKFLRLSSWIKKTWEKFEKTRRDPSQKSYRLEEEQELYARMNEILEKAYTYYIEIRRFDERAIGFYSPTVEKELEQLFAIGEEIKRRLR